MFTFGFIQFFYHIHNISYPFSESEKGQRVRSALSFVHEFLERLFIKIIVMKISSLIMSMNVFEKQINKEIF